MTNTPDDVMNTARACQDAAEAECQKKLYVYGFGTGNAKTVLDLHIARAILAERERCAGIAETRSPDDDSLDWQVRQQVAKAIRAGS